MEYRRNTVIPSELIRTASTHAGYMQWYMGRTVAFIGNPGVAPAPAGGFQDDGARIQLMVKHFYVPNSYINYFRNLVFLTKNFVCRGMPWVIFTGHLRRHLIILRHSPRSLSA